jgi:hypothetical protein
MWTGRRRGFAKSFAQIASLAIAAPSLFACNDTRSSSELLEPWADQVITLSPQGPRPGDHALVYTTNLEFVVVKKLDAPRKVCHAIPGEPGTATVRTAVLEENCVPQPDGSSRCETEGLPRTQDVETEVKVPGETQTLCEDESTMDMPRTSRVVAVIHPRHAGAALDPASVQELSLGIGANELLRQSIPEGELEPAFNRLKPEDRTLVAIKGAGARLSSVSFHLGDHFKPGDDILIDATVENSLGGGFSILGSPEAVPKFRSPL